ncbi:MAG: type II secretion system F family protein [Nitrospirae bacterium]|nr:type II secretion system F family protein [Nitrospirota bacterium]
MPSFYYRVAHHDGRTVEGYLDEENEEHARALLKSQGYLVFQVRKGGGWAGSLLGGFKQSYGKVSHSEFLVFNQELLALLKAGLPILKVWDLLIERARHPAFQAALRAVRQDIRGGVSSSDALARHPEHFPRLYVATLKAGEQSGNLPEVLQRYITYLKLMIELRQKITKALAYPGFLVLVGVGVIAFLLTYVMPTFVAIYGDQAKSLPPATLVLMNLVKVIQGWFPLFLLGTVVGAIAFRYWYRSESGRPVWDRFLLALPGLGALLTRHYTIQLTRTLATVLAGGIPLVEALHIAKGSVTNREVSDALGGAVDRVRNGETLAASLADIKTIPKMALEMIAVGEETGSLETMLRDVAEFYESELDVRLSQLTTWIEPVLILVMGLFVGTIVVIMYLPVFQMAGTVQ